MKSPREDPGAGVDEKYTAPGMLRARTGGVKRACYFSVFAGAGLWYFSASRSFFISILLFSAWSPVFPVAAAENPSSRLEAGRRHNPLMVRC